MLKSNPLVSIIIPVYNGANFLREAIDSALRQTYSNIEVIVVNDGSNDNGATREIARSFGEKIRYFEKENGGVASALNLGVRNMNGDYFSWLSHDDLYMPRKIETALEALDAAGNMLLPVQTGWTKYYMDDGSLSDQLFSTGKFSLDYYQSGLLSVLMGLINGCALLIHKRYFKEYGLFDESLLTTQDYAKWFEMFRKEKFIYVNDVLVKSRIHKMQTTNTFDDIKGNQSKLYKWMAEELCEDDAEYLGIDYYKLLGMALTRFDNCGHSEATSLIANKMLRINGKKHDDKESREFMNRINPDAKKYIYIVWEIEEKLWHELSRLDM